MLQVNATGFGGVDRAVAEVCTLVVLLSRAVVVVPI